MRKRSLGLIVFGSIVVLAHAPVVSAQNFSLTVRAAMVSSDAAMSGIVGEEDRFEFSTGYLAGAALGYELAGGFRAEAEYAYLHNPLDTDDGVPTEGNFRSHIAMANLGYEFGDGSSSPWKPYLGAGAGVARVNEDYQYFSDSSNTFVTQRDSWTAFAYQARAGITYRVSDALNLSAGYRYLEIGDDERTLPDGRDVKVEAPPHHLLELGASFRF